MRAAPAPWHGPPLVVLLTTAALGALAMGAALRVVDVRTYAVLAVAVVVLVAATGSSTTVPLAVVAIATVGLLRRITAGPTGYVLNDPLVLLPVVVLLPAAVRTGRSGDPLTRRMTWLLAALTASAVLGVVRGSGATVAYGLVVAALPLLVGRHVAAGSYPGLFARVVRLLPLLGGLIGGYGILQRLAPPRWDLAWLTTQQALLTSVGVPVPGRFRIWGTAESPGAYAPLLGLAVLCAVVPLVARAPGGRAAWELPVAALSVASSVSALALTSVRAALFALPVALLVGSASTPGIRRSVLVVAGAAGLAAAVLLPPVLAPPLRPDARYDLSTLDQDQSFQEREALLGQFGPAATAGFPFGTGPGTAGQAGRLSGGAVTGTVDNGYLVRLQETGVVGLGLFVVVLATGARAAVRRRRAGTPQPLDPTALAVLTYFVLLDLSGPQSASPAALVLWLAVGSLGTGALAVRSAAPPALDLVLR